MDDRRAEPDHPRRILLLAHRLASPSATGIGRYYVEIATALAQIADPAAHRYSVTAPRERQRAGWVRPPLEQRRIPGSRKAVALAWNLLGRPAVDRLVPGHDLVHTLHPWVPTPTMGPLVTTIHDLMPMLHPRWYGPVERRAFHRGVRHARDHAQLVITESEHAAGLLTSELGISRDRIRVVWGAAGDDFRARSSCVEATVVCARHGVDPGRYLVALGAVSTRKNLSVVLRALTRVDPHLLGSPALLVVGPAGAGAGTVADEVVRLGLEARVRFAGYVPDAELPTLVGASLALVHPSRDEGFGITPIEAMAAGVPAVASDAGAIPEVCGGAAVLVAPDDVEGWSAAIASLAADPQRRAEVIAAGDLHQERFRWTRAAAATMAVHDEVLDQR